jgi:indole-3-glycerol phosphate synthase
MSQLEPILRSTRDAVGRRREAVPLAALERAGADRLASDAVRPFAEALTRPGLSLIAEHKRRSPSAGVIRDGLALEDVVTAYERAGAAALSVLTEERSFGGSLADLQAARAASALPILRKDFIVDPYQLHESLAAGADAVLLIVAALTESMLAELHAMARALGLAALAEVHDREELATAVAIGAEIIGINNRDLSTLTVDPRRTFELLPLLPAGTVSVAESGFSRSDQLERVAEAGVDAVLIGEALMRSADIESACRRLIASV